MKKLIILMFFTFHSEGFLFAQEMSDTQIKEVFGIKNDIQETLKLSNEGDANAQFELGIRYLLGLDVEQSDETAAAYYLKASKQNHKVAQYNLGTLYFSREMRDIKQAVKWIKLSAENGFPDAQNFLAGLYIRGKYIPKNALKAIKWYRLAANNLNISSLNSLALIYLNGNGVEKNTLEAVGLFKEAALKGHEAAQKNLAQLYISGTGVEQDFIKAYAWLTLSAQQGFLPAEKIRNNLTLSMSSAQVDEGILLATEIVKSKIVN